MNEKMKVALRRAGDGPFDLTKYRIQGNLNIKDLPSPIKYKDQDRYYEGQMKGYRPHGAGRMLLNGGILYEGQFVFGQPQGHGRIINNDGEVYIGGINNKLEK